ncbi:MAG: hypothetical protein EPN93_19195 [Spirochaetes bacterium]|nr:MAG: hypothetical protein EPN93_19195 [Spirochaetota bacterium]
MDPVARQCDENALNICRPGFGASCAMCCGSHNLSCTREELGRVFSARTARLEAYSREYLVSVMRSSRSALTGSYYFPAERFSIPEPPPLFESAAHCPFAGFVGDGATIGCILHPGTRARGEIADCFLSYRGKTFTCTAGEALEPHHINFAARLTGDWFYYGLLIHHAALLKIITTRYGSPRTIDARERAGIFCALEEFRNDSARVHSLDNYFGVPDRPGEIAGRKNTGTDTKGGTI